MTNNTPYRTPSNPPEREPTLVRTATWTLDDIKVTWTENDKVVYLSGYVLTIDEARKLAGILEEAASEADSGR